MIKSFFINSLSLLVGLFPFRVSQHQSKKGVNFLLFQGPLTTEDIVVVVAGTYTVLDLLLTKAEKLLDHAIVIRKKLRKFKQPDDLPKLGPPSSWLLQIWTWNFHSAYPPEQTWHFQPCTTRSRQQPDLSVQWGISTRCATASRLWRFFTRC